MTTRKVEKKIYISNTSISLLLICYETQSFHINLFTLIQNTFMKYTGLNNNKISLFLSIKESKNSLHKQNITQTTRSIIITEHHPQSNRIRTKSSIIGYPISTAIKTMHGHSFTDAKDTQRRSTGLA